MVHGRTGVVIRKPAAHLYRERDSGEICPSAAHRKLAIRAHFVPPRYVGFGAQVQAVLLGPVAQPRHDIADLFPRGHRRERVAAGRVEQEAPVRGRWPAECCGRGGRYSAPGRRGPRPPGRNRRPPFETFPRKRRRPPGPPARPTAGLIEAPAGPTQHLQIGLFRCSRHYSHENRFPHSHPAHGGYLNQTAICVKLARTVLFESIGTLGAFYVRSARNTGDSSRKEFRLHSG